MAAEGRSQGTGARRRKWSVQVKRLDGHSAALDLAREPSLAPRRHEDDAVPARRLEVRRQICDDPLGTARAVRLDQLGNSHDTFCTPTDSATSV
jgi:hypothetical protein